MLHGEIKHLNNSGNCVSLDDINILNINKKDIRGLWCAEENDIYPVDLPESHDDLIDNQLSEFSLEVTIYIAGFVVERLKKANKMHWLHSGSSINGNGI